MSVSGSRELAAHLLRRFLWGIVIIWATLTATWALVSLKPRRTGRFSNPLEEGGLGEQPADNYFKWLGDFVTLDWGPQVIEAWTTAAPVTAAYLIPAVVLGSVLGIAVSTYGAMVPGGYIDRSVSAISHLGIGIPTFVVVEAAIAIAPSYGIILEPYDQQLSLFHMDNIIGLTIPAAIVGLPIFAFVTRYARQESLNERTAEYVKTARAKGAGRLRVAAHVFRNAWLALVQVVFSELLGVIILATIVLEYAFAMPGIAIEIFEGFERPIEGMVISAVFVVVTVAVVGSLLQDIGRLFLVPDRNE